MEKYLKFFKSVPKTGVIYVLEKATEMGYHPKDPNWSNLGQGSPDTDIHSKASKPLVVTPENSAYAPVSGRIDLREKVAEYYNKLYRSDKPSKYTYKNICIAGGGRTALSRVVASLGNINMGHFIPDYTAYEELLGTFKNFVPIPILLKASEKYKISPECLEEEILGRGLSALLVSNPCNPTGQYLSDEDMNQWVQMARSLNCLMIFDEFYSHFLYDKQKETLSSASQVNDVNKDPVIIINGLSKNWQSPGWRIGWVVAPEKVIEKISSVGSFLDGGAVHPLQEEAVQLIENLDSKKIQSLQKEFRDKRDYTTDFLLKLGFIVEAKTCGTFYIWADISNLPTPLNDGESFFKECLKEQVIVVPGVFFDVNPGQRRRENSRYKNYVRISFGPKIAQVKLGLESIKRVVEKFTKA